MKFTKQDICWAVEKGLLSEEQALSLLDALKVRYEDQPQFGLGHVIYYFGAILIFAAMTWFMVRAWDTLGGPGILSAALVYAVLFFTLGAKLGQKPGMKIPAGLLTTAGVFMTPLAVYGFQRWTGWWWDVGVFTDYVWGRGRGDWFAMELGTVLVGLITLYFVRFPFTTLPITLSLWFMSLDLAPLHSRNQVSLIFGLILLGLTYCVDRKTKDDYAFWGYLFGLMAFWGGFSLMDSDQELAKFGYCMVNVGLIFLSVFLGRRVFIVFGTLGCFIYLGHLSYKVFQDSLLFPVVLSGLGLGVIFLGVLYQKNRMQIEAHLLAALPERLKKMRPVQR